MPMCLTYTYLHTYIQTLQCIPVFLINTIELFQIICIISHRYNSWRDSILFRFILGFLGYAFWARILALFLGNFRNYLDFFRYYWNFWIFSKTCSYCSGLLRFFQNISKVFQVFLWFSGAVRIPYEAVWIFRNFEVP